MNTNPEQMKKLEQLKKQPAGQRKRLASATAAFAALLSLAAAYGIDARISNGYYRRSAMDAIGFRKFKLQVEKPSEFPYPFSPWERYAQLEERLLDELKIPETDIPRQTGRIIAAANEIADRVAKRALKAMDTYDVADVSETATKDSLMRVIADEIARAGIFYSEESLLSNSFNPRMHEKGKSHLDCDLLAYLMCHIGRRLNLPMYVVSGPVHAYLFVVTDADKNLGYVIEPTQFRRIEEGEGYVNFAGRGIGDKFFSSFEQQRKDAPVRATARFEEAAGLHIPIRDTRLLEDAMAANILAGLISHADTKGDMDMKIRIYNRLFNIARKGTDCYLVTSNAFTMSLNLAQECIGKKRYCDAETLLKNAMWLRRTRNELIVDKEPVEEILLGKLYWEKGDRWEALRQLRKANELYAERGLFHFRGDSDKPIALNEYHCLLLRYLAMAELEHGVMPLSRIYNEFVIPAYNHYVVNGLEGHLNSRR